jgi:hypothetical protein
MGYILGIVTAVYGTSMFLRPGTFDVPWWGFILLAFAFFVQENKVRTLERRAKEAEVHVATVTKLFLEDAQI